MSNSSATIRQLTAAMAQGDAIAIARFYNDYFDLMLLEAHRASGRDEQFCLDIVQDAMLKVIRSIVPMETEAQLGQWTRRLVQNVAYDLLRADLSRKRREANAVPRRTDSSAQRSLDEIELQLNWLAAELNSMNEDDARLLGARYKRGWTLRQIGQELGISPSAVDGRLRRLLVRLKQRFEETGGDE